jgi:hypothetical protein
VEALEEKRMLRKLMVAFSINAAGCLTSVTRGFNKLVLDHYSIGCVLHMCGSTAS